MSKGDCSYFKTGRGKLREVEDTFYQLAVESYQYSDTQRQGMLKALISHAKSHLDEKRNSSGNKDHTDYCEAGLHRALDGLKNIGADDVTTIKFPEGFDQVMDWYGDTFVETERYCLNCAGSPECK